MPEPKAVQPWRPQLALTASDERQFLRFIGVPDASSDSVGSRLTKASTKLLLNSVSL